MGDKFYVVTDEYITVPTPTPTGQMVILGYYRDAVLPLNADEKSIKHHLGTGQIRQLKPEEVAPPADEETPAVDPGDKPPVQVGDDVPEPKKTDGKDAWVDFAVSKGADRADIEAKKATKDDLIATYGTKN